jgi:hypothetical protein
MNDSGLSIEASDLGWKPGIWPSAFTYLGTRWYRGDSIYSNEIFMGYHYSSLDRGALRVWND